MIRLAHLTLNTGDLQMTEPVPADITNQLRAICEAEEGEIPAVPGWFIDIMYPRTEATGPRIPGAAYFQIANRPSMSKAPVIMAICCWHEAESEHAWLLTMTNYFTLRKVLEAANLWSDPPRERPSVPWLAVTITPHIVAVDRETIEMLADIERCFFWALARHEPV